MTTLTRTLAEQLIELQGFNVVIPDYYTSIESVAFYNTKIESVVIPETITSIGKSAFSYNNLSEVVIPDSVTTIAYGAFLDNDLTRLVLSKNLTSIENNAFNDNNLTSIVIPDSVVDLGSFVFAKNSLKHVSIGPKADFDASAFPENVTLLRRTMENADNVIYCVEGKGKLRGTSRGDQFTFDRIDAFNKETVDRIIGFKSKQGDTIGVDPAAFPSLRGAEEITFTSTDSKDEMKLLRNSDYDFVYFKDDKHGFLYYNGNGQEDGWGGTEGGIFAILKGKPELTLEDFTLLA